VMDPVMTAPESMSVLETDTLENIARDMTDANETTAHVVDEDGKPVGSIGIETLVAAMVTPATQETEPTEQAAPEPEEAEKKIA